MTCWMRRRVDSETARLPLSAYDTVLRDTPERRAISPMFIDSLTAVRLRPGAYSNDLVSNRFVCVARV
jgi:hypothetical protein